MALDICRDRACTDVIETLHPDADRASPTADLPTGVVFWRATANGSSSATWQLRIPARSAPVSSAWGTALDVDGDGITDLALTQGGRILVYPGSTSGLPSRPRDVIGSVSLQVDAVNAGYLSGGDFDGDGYVDIFASRYEPGRAGLFATIYRGSSTGVRRENSADVFLPTDDPYFSLFSLAGAGDVNGDGYADVAFVVREHDTMHARVLLGGPTAACSEMIELALADGEGPGSLIAAGDIDGDGLSDLLLGLTSSPATGRVAVFRGGPTGDHWSRSEVISAPAAAENTFGNGVSVGDVNGDGYGDVAFATDVRTFIYEGSNSGLGPAPSTGIAITSPRIGGGADINGDGYDDVLVAPFDGTTPVTIRMLAGGSEGLASMPFQTLVGAGSFAFLLLLGDIDGDGDLDLTTTAGESASGALAIYRNQGSGYLDAPNQILQVPFAEMVGVAIE